MIEMKNGNKYFGIIKEIDDSREYIKFIIIKDKYNKTHIINDSEISRLEVLD